MTGKHNPNAPLYGPYSDKLARLAIDGRSREWQAFREIRIALIEELGGREALNNRTLGVIDSIAREEVIARKFFNKIVLDDANTAPATIKWYSTIENGLCRRYQMLGVERPVDRSQMDALQYVQGPRRREAAA